MSKKITMKILDNIVEFSKNYTLLKNIMEEENKFDPKYKTELCKKYQSTGKCPYGHKCRFAHGKEELLSKTQGVNYKKKQCKTFYEKACKLNDSFGCLSLDLYMGWVNMPSRKI